MRTYFITVNALYPVKKVMKLAIKKWDIKKWIICKETSKNGYEHYHVRYQASGTDLRSTARFWRTGHVEEANDVWEYERKDGHFWCSDDNTEILKIRYGKLNKLQISILKELDKQTDREIDVWIDSKGNHGKTWMAMHMWETGRALIIPRAQISPEKISAYICSAYRGEPYIIIDIPRSAPIEKRLYEVLEEIKDGLVFDTRYSGRSRNIRGTKLCVFCNKKLDVKCLSYDRWDLHGVRENGDALS